ncbi:MAG: SDR family oxidoreductase [Legionella sp.]|nr:MAG: SDR family oxidoreductase [Legionella sp.]
MTTLITGATKGIGLALGLEFARQGHDLLLVARDEQRLKELAYQLNEQYQVKVDYIVADLSKPGSAFTLYHAVQNRGIWVKCLVNNAGIGYMGTYAEMDVTKLQDLMQVNMISLSELTRLYLNDFLGRNEGSILQVSSTAAFLPGPMMAAYYASKAYVSSLSQAIAYEIKDANVSLSILCPGPTRTEFFHSAGMENSRISKGLTGMMDSEKVAQIAYKGLMKKKLFIIPGFRNKLTVYAAILSPKRIAVALAAYFHHKGD